MGHENEKIKPAQAPVETEGEKACKALERNLAFIARAVDAAQARLMMRALRQNACGKAALALNVEELLRRVSRRARSGALKGTRTVASQKTLDRVSEYRRLETRPRYEPKTKRESILPLDVAAGPRDVFRRR